MSQATQSAFASGLRHPGDPIPAGLSAWTGVEPVRRYGVYRNNVTSGLIAALAVRFPVTEKIVGSEFFRAMARAFVQSQPPQTPVLLHYGHNFDRFVANFEGLEALPYLADVVRLENARVKAYHAADLPPLDATALARFDGERLSLLRFRFHPAFSVVRSRHPILTIWEMNDDDGTPGPIEPWAGEDALVVRPALSVLMHRLPPGGATFLSSLAGGATLGDAAELAMRQADNFDLTGNLAGLLGSGAVVAAHNDDQGVG
jgi:hypothetical protein